MADFRFRLATLLRLREAARDERRAQLAEAYQAEEIIKKRLTALDDDIAQLRDRYKHAAEPGSVNVDSLLESQRFEAIVKAEKQVIAGQVELLAKEIEKRRDALIAADREVRVLEKLRETGQERHQQLELAKEAKMLDEVAGRTSTREVIF